VVTSDGGTGCAPIGVNAWASCDASAIISPRPAAANRTVFFMRCHLSFPFAARRAEKRFLPRNAIDRAAPGRRAIAAFGIAPTRAAWGMAVLGVSNFAQTVAARPDSFPHPAG
jgi:hypothetical protein